MFDQLTLLEMLFYTFSGILNIEYFEFNFWSFWTGILCRDIISTLSFAAYLFNFATLIFERIIILFIRTFLFDHTFLKAMRRKLECTPNNFADHIGVHSKKLNGNTKSLKTDLKYIIYVCCNMTFKSFTGQGRITTFQLIYYSRMGVAGLSWFRTGVELQ